MERAPPPTKRPRDDAAAPPKKKKRRKTKKKKAADGWTQPTARHAFDVSTPSDHAETPVNAYEDLAPFLRAVGGRVYDPYYCDGGVVRRLAALGFRDVVNENRDFYADVSNGTMPSHAVLVTNPPYSGDHVDRLISHVVAAKTPFALLIPTYYLGRDVWRRVAASLSAQPFYVCPRRRYAYLPPAWAREPAAARTTAPFTTAWFCWRPQGATGLQFSGRVDVFRSVASVASQYRDVTDSLKKRPNPKARKRQKAARLAKAKAYS